MSKNSSFSCLWPFLCVIAHSFWVVLGFARPVRPVTCLRYMTKHSSFSCFLVIFMSYCPLFWGSRRICMPRKNPNMFERYDQKIVVFTFYCHFHELLPKVLGLQGDLQQP